MIISIREMQARYKLTAKEREMWQLVYDYWMREGRSPTIYELAKDYSGGVYGSTAARVLKRMRTKGYIAWPEGAKRAIQCYPILSEGMDDDQMRREKGIGG